MITRLIQDRLIQSLKRDPAVVLTGPRQAGKTTLARMLADIAGKESLYLDLEDSHDRNMLTDPRLFLEKHTDKLVIIDEAQVMPELFPQLRSIIDSDRRPGRFLLLGSASPTLERQANQSLAGRVSYHDLSPFLSAELPGTKIEQLWLRGGFPLSLLAPDDEYSAQWRKNYIRSYLGYDLRTMGYDIRLEPLVLSELLELLAHYQGQLLNQHSIATSVQISRASVARLVEILRETFMVRMLRPYSSNLKSQIVKTPKFYFRDTGILHSLLRIYDMDTLMASRYLGVSWESFCIEQIVSRLDDSYSVNYLRTANKEEVDLVIRAGITAPPILVEFKYSNAPKLEKGFYAVKEMLKPIKCFVVYPGAESYPISEDTTVLAMRDIDRILLV